MEPTNYALWTAAAVIITNAASWLILRYLSDLADFWKRAVVAGIALVLAGAEAFYGGTLDVTDWSRSWLVIFLSASGLWLVLWKPLGDAAQGPPAEGLA